MPIVAVYSPVPGVGSTTTALNLLAAIGRRGKRPWAIDLDARGQLSSAFLPYPPDADETMRAFFTDAVPLSHLAHITRSGIVVCPAHPRLADLDRSLGKSLPVLTKLRRAVRAPDTVTGPVVVDCPATVGAMTLSAVFAAHLTVIPMDAHPPSVEAVLRLERAFRALEAALKEGLPRKYALTSTDVSSDVLPDSIRDALLRSRLWPGSGAPTARIARLESRRDDVQEREAEGYDALMEELTELRVLDR